MIREIFELLEGEVVTPLLLLLLLLWELKKWKFSQMLMGLRIVIQDRLKVQDT